VGLILNNKKALNRQKDMTNKAGRPKLELDEEQVYKLASLNVTVKDMADVLGCSKSALENNYLDVIDQGRANLRASILRKQYEVGITDKNVTMLIWMGKQHLGQADKKAVEIDDKRKVEDYTIPELQQILADYRREAIADKKLKH